MLNAGEIDALSTQIDAAILAILRQYLIATPTPIPVPAPQPVPQPQPQPSTFAVPDIMDMDMTGTVDQSIIASGANVNPVSAPAIMRFLQEGGGGNELGGMSGGVYGTWSSYIQKFSGDGNPVFGVDPDTGMHYLECGIPGGIVNALDGMNWFAAFGLSGLSAQKPVEEIYCAYTVMITPSVITGMNPALLGVKFSGPFALGGISWIGEHSTQQPQITDSVAINDYSYSAEGAQRGDYLGGTDYTNAPREPVAQWLTWEHHAKMNTVGQADGIKQLWVTAGTDIANRKLLLDRSDVNWRGSNALALWAGLQIQFYMGGQNDKALGPCRWRIARARISTKPIGLPPEFLALPAPAPAPAPSGSLPAWRQGRAKDAPFEIAGTAQLSGCYTEFANPIAGALGPFMLIDGWNGVTSDGDRTLYSWLSGGHGCPLNVALALNLGVDAPAFSVLDPGSKDADLTVTSSYMLDGRAVSRHTYHGTQYVRRPDGIARIMQVGCDAPYQMYMPGCAYDGNTVDGFRLDTNKGEAAATYPDRPFGSPTNVQSVCTDPRTGDIYIASADNYARWLNASNTWQGIDTYSPNGGYIPGSWEWHPTLIDAKRNAWVHLREALNGNAPQLQQLDMATWKSTMVPITGLPDIDGYSTAVHDLDNDRYLTVQQNGLWAISPGTAVATRLCDMPAPANGTQNRLQYLAHLGGVAYLPAFSNTVVFVPTR